MIPRTIHYCWFGRGEMPKKVQECIATWHKNMPDWNYKLWTEDDFDVTMLPYTKEAYEAKKYAFVSDVVRLWALYHEGGVYLDTDVEVFKPFDDLLGWKAFAGFEGSKKLPLGTCVMASIPMGEWVKEQLEYYQDRHFKNQDGTFDLTTNVQFVSGKMRVHGFIQNGEEQDYKDLHIFPLEYFCPRRTTGEYYRTENTHCDHLGMGSWADRDIGWKAKVGKLVGQKNMIRLIKIKRKLFG